MSGGRPEPQPASTSEWILVLYDRLDSIQQGQEQLVRAVDRIQVQIDNLKDRLESAERRQEAMIVTLARVEAQSGVLKERMDTYEKRSAFRNGKFAGIIIAAGAIGSFIVTPMSDRVLHAIGWIK